MIDLQKIREELLKQKESSLSEFSTTLMPGSKKILGVRVPKLRKIAQQIAKEDYKYYVENGPDEYFEDQMLKAFTIGYAKDDIETILSYATNFVPQIHDWAVNDAFCQTFKIARKNEERVYEWLMNYVEGGSEFEQRVVAVMMLSHFLVEDYIDRVLSTMDRLTNDSYYTQMGVAWCVATAYAKFPAQTLNYLHNNKLADQTFNKSIQKMRESYRVPQEDKDMLKSMKRKV